MRCVRFVRPPFVRLPFVLLLLAVCAARASAEDISGTITATKIILEDSRLVGDVMCTTTTTPCLQFGAPDIALHLNGFIVTGPANPDDTTTCNPTSGTPFSDGISNGTNAATSQAGVRIIGPGMVQKFRRHGLFIVGAPGVSTNVTVRNVTSHANCFSGLLTNGMTNSVLDGVVSIRNAANSGTAPCGGNCLVNSNNNRIVNGLFGGNGSLCAAALCVAPPTITSNNDFGMGLIAGSAGNLVESNSLTGNTNGLLIQAGAAGNIIRSNIIVGNPPSQLSRTYGTVGFDIKDEATANGARNTFERNWCISYSGPGPSPCPNFPGVAAPTISAATATPGVLWPPNGQMIPVTIAVTVSDDLDPTPVCRITNVTSNDSSDNSNWTVTAPLGLQVRAERNGLGSARVYSITVTCTNTSLLSATALVTVVVPHDQR